MYLDPKPFLFLVLTKNEELITNCLYAKPYLHLKKELAISLNWTLKVKNLKQKR